MNIEIANRLFEFRKAYGYSQEELAEKIGVSRQAISKWERSESSPDTDNLIALAKLYNISIDELINGDEKPTKPEETQSEPEAEAVNTEPPKDSVNISMRGLDVQSKDGDNVHIGIDGIRVNPADQQQFNNHIFSNDKSKKKKPWISALIWLCGIILFLLVGAVAPSGWSVSWIIILLIPALDSGIDAVVENKPHKFIYPLMVVALFCALGMSFRLWHPAWILFLTIPIYYIFCDSYKKSEDYQTTGTRSSLFITVAIICALVLSSTLGLVCRTAFSGGIKSSPIMSFVNYDNAENYSIGSSSVDATQVNAISVDWVNGNIILDESEGDKITFTETEQTDEDMKLRYIVEDNTLKIEFCKSHIRTSFLENHSKDLTLTVPDKLFSELDIDTVNGNITVNGTSSSELSIDTVSGDILAEGSFSRLSFDSVSGTIQIKALTAPNSIDFDSVSGNCDIYLPADISGFRVEYDSVSGKVTTDGFDSVTNSEEKTLTYGNGSTDISFDSVSAKVTIHALTETA